MAKKSGKTAPAPAAQEAQTSQAQTPAASESKKGYFINGVSVKNFTDRTTGQGDEAKNFKSVKFFLPKNPETRSKFGIDPSDTKTNGFSILVREGQVLPNTMRGTGAVDPNHYNIRMCNEEDKGKEMVKATVYSAKDENGHYPTVMISSETVKTAFEQNRDEYKASQKSAVKTAEQVAEAQAEAPAADADYDMDYDGVTV